MIYPVKPYYKYCDHRGNVVMSSMGQSVDSQYQNIIDKDYNDISPNANLENETPVLGMSINNDRVVKYDESFNIFYGDSNFTYYNSNIDDLKMELSIAKSNVKFSPSSEYYKQQLIKVKKILGDELKRGKIKGNA